MTKPIGFAHEKYVKFNENISLNHFLRFLSNNFDFLYLQGSTKCRARVITKLFSNGLERVIHKSFVHNHNPKNEVKAMKKDRF